MGTKFEGKLFLSMCLVRMYNSRVILHKIVKFCFERK